MCVKGMKATRNRCWQSCPSRPTRIVTDARKITSCRRVFTTIANCHVHYFSFEFRRPSFAPPTPWPTSIWPAVADCWAFPLASHFVSPSLKALSMTVDTVSGRGGEVGSDIDFFILFSFSNLQYASPEI